MWEKTRRSWQGQPPGPFPSPHGPSLLGWVGENTPQHGRPPVDSQSSTQRCPSRGARKIQPWLLTLCQGSKGKAAMDSASGIFWRHLEYPSLWEPRDPCASSWISEKGDRACRPEALRGGGFCLQRACLLGLPEGPWTRAQRSRRPEPRLLICACAPHLLTPQGLAGPCFSGTENWPSARSPWQPGHSSCGPGPQVQSGSSCPPPPPRAFPAQPTSPQRPGAVRFRGKGPQVGAGAWECVSSSSSEGRSPVITQALDGWARQETSS